MSLKYMFLGSVILVAIIFSIIYAVLESYVLAVLAFGLGGMWLLTNGALDRDLGTFFFLAFVVLAVIAGLNDAFMPLTLLGMSANLAAWDIARFSARIAGESEQAARVVLEAQHLRLLWVIIGLGFLIALLPLLFQLAIPFVIVCGVALLALLTLQQSMRSLRRE